MKLVIISGYLYDLNDNIKQFLTPNTDLYVHTWQTECNKRWISKLQRYSKYCNILSVDLEKPLYSKKLYSYFYSTWKVINNVGDLTKYEKIVKFKPNLDTSIIQYQGSIDKYFKKAYIQSRPLLNDTIKESCIYGSIYYQTMDERMFSGYPLAFKKAFHILFKDFYNQMIDLDGELSQKYGEDYEGSIFWKEWFENKGIKLIQDLDLKLPNNKQQ